VIGVARFDVVPVILPLVWEGTGTPDIVVEDIIDPARCDRIWRTVIWFLKGCCSRRFRVDTEPWCQGFISVSLSSILILPCWSSSIMEAAVKVLLTLAMR